MFAKRLFYICAGMFLVAEPSFAEIAAITGSPQPTVLMEDGDVLRYDAGRWARVQNVFTYSNNQGDHCRAAGTIVDAAISPFEDALYVMTDQGFLIRGSSGGSVWACQLEGETIFSAMGREPGTIKSFGAGAESTGELLAMTVDGDVLQVITPSQPQFSYLGNIFAEPTPALSRTIGGIKARYR